jgi:excisionase family DNA binding protein
MVFHVVAAEAVADASASPDELLTASQAGDHLRTGERFVRRLAAGRRISYVKLGTCVRLQRSVLDAFIGSGRVPQESEVHRLELFSPVGQNMRCQPGEQAHAAMPRPARRDDVGHRRRS